jgi:hypothetical protein
MDERPNKEMEMNVTETMDLVKQAHANPKQMDDIAKSFNVATGLTAYDLEAPAKKIVPVITPLRNMVPRVKSGSGDTATRWKAITAINTGNAHPGISEGNRAPVIADSVTSLTASYVGIGLENRVSFEADYAAESFDDVKARAVENLLYASILKEEDMLLGGNRSVALGTTPTPTVANAGTGGSIAAATYNVGCVALTVEAYRRSGVNANGVPTSLSQTSADGGTSYTIPAGAAQRSATAATTTTGTTSTISASVAAVKGAVAYAWYAGTSGNEQLVAITTINSVVLTALPANGTNQAWSAAPTSDKSTQDGFAYDGFLYTALGTSGAYFNALATGTAGTGTVLTADGKGGVVQINDALGWFWDNLQLQPDAIWANRQEVNNITTKCVGSATSPFRFNVTGGQAQGSLVGGGKVTEYQSPVDSSIIPINVHPKMPAGTVMFTTRKLPYALNNVGDTFRLKMRREWYQIEWPLRTRQYEYGIYSDGVFQHFFPVAMGVITNVANG